MQSGRVYVMQSPLETPLETRWGPASYTSHRGKESSRHPGREGPRGKRCGPLSAPSCVPWADVGPASAGLWEAKMLAREGRPALHFHPVPLPSSQENRQRRQSMHEFLRDLALFTVLEMSGFLKALTVCVREPCSVNLIRFLCRPGAL